MFKNVLSVAMPIIIGCVFSLFIEMLNLMYAGRMGDPALVAAVGLGNMYANVTCLLILYGMNGAIATLCSQAYGSGNMRKVGVYLNKGRICACLIFIPIFAVMFLCERFLLVLGIDSETAHQAQNYTYGMIVALFFSTQFDATRNYLNAVQKSQVITYISIGASIIHVFVLYIMIDTLQMGIIGASIGTIITYSMNSVIVTIYCMMQEDLKESFFFPDRECFENLWEYLKIGVPSAMIISFEYWSFEVQAIYASYISVVAVGSMVILLNALTVVMMIPVGFQIAATVFVGKSMGEGDHKKAIKYQILVNSLNFVVLIFICIICIINSKGVASIFTNQQDLLNTVSDNMKYCILFLFIHGIVNVLLGSLKGIGKQALGSALILLGFYVIGNPASLLLCFYFDFGMGGLFLGFCCGSVTIGVLILIVIFKFTNWRQMAIDIKYQMRDNQTVYKEQVENEDIKMKLIT
eukprot:403363675